MSANDSALAALARTFPHAMTDPLQSRADAIAHADAAEDRNRELTRERYSSGETLYAVVSVPKPGAPVSAWLAEWRALGPYPTRDAAETVRRELTTGAAWHTRVIALRPARACEVSA